MYAFCAYGDCAAIARFNGDSVILRPNARVLSKQLARYYYATPREVKVVLVDECGTGVVLPSTDEVSGAGPLPNYYAVARDSTLSARLGAC